MLTQRCHSCPFAGATALSDFVDLHEHSCVEVTEGRATIQRLNQAVASLATEVSELKRHIEMNALEALKADARDDQVRAGVRLLLRGSLKDSRRAGVASAVQKLYGSTTQGNSQGPTFHRTPKQVHWLPITSSDSCIQP